METTDTGYEQTPTVGELAKALALAQAEMENALKDSENPAFKQGAKVSKYADLAAVREAAKPIYKHGLSVVQQVLTSADAVGVRTVLMHESGEWMASRAYVKAQPGPQGAGSVVTYLRRYMLAAMLGIAQEDDDGNAGSFTPARGGDGNGHRQGTVSSPPASAPPAPKWFEGEKGKAKLTLMHTVLGKLSLGEKEADAKSLKGKPREEFTHAAKLAYLCWAAGRDGLTSSKELTEAEADKVIKKAQTGEVPA